MDIFQLLEIATSVSNRLDTHWALFITVHLALIGGILYIDRPLSKMEKGISVFVYSGFAVVNYLMMLDQIQFLNSIHQDIIALKSDPCCQDSHSLAFIERRDEVGRFTKAVRGLLIVHIVMYILVVISLVMDNTRFRPQKPATDLPE